MDEYPVSGGFALQKRRSPGAGRQKGRVGSGERIKHEIMGRLGGQAH